MKKRDIILIIIVGIVILQGLILNKIFNSGRGNKIEIFVDNKLYREYPITANEKIKIKTKNGVNEISIHDKVVEMTHSNCPDKVCVNTGKISKPGQSIVCLPHRINIKIVGDEKEQGDNDVEAK